MKQFDLSKALSDTRHRHLLPPPLFCSLDRLERLRKSSARHHTQFGPETPWISHAPLEEWAPDWLGEGRSHASRKKLRADRLLEGSAPRLFNTVLTFWLCHFAIGECSLTAVLAHVAVLSRIAEEFSVRFALRYEYSLLDHIRYRIKGSERFSLSDVIGKRVHSVWQPLEIEAASRKRSRSREPRQPARLKPRLSARPQPKSASGKALRKKICLDYDPARGRQCPAGATCLFDHLDTRTADGRKRFDHVSSLVHANRKSTGREIGAAPSGSQVVGAVPSKQLALIPGLPPP